MAAHSVLVEEISNGIRLTETINGIANIREISINSRLFLRVTNQDIIPNSTYQILDRVGEIYNLPAFPDEFTLVDISGVQYFSQTGTELIENSQYLLPFTEGVDTNSEAVAIGSITSTSANIILSLHSTGFNKVKISGHIYQKNTADTFPFTPVVSDVKILILYALPTAQIFYLAEGVESTEAVEPEIPAGALIVRRIVVTTEGADIDPGTISGYKEKADEAWKSVSIPATGGWLQFSADKASAFNVTPLNVTAVLTPSVYGIYTNVTDSKELWSGKTFLIRNNSVANLSLHTGTPPSTPTALKILGFENSLNVILKPYESAIVKVNQAGTGLVVITKMGGGSDFPEIGSNGDVLVKDDTLTDGVKWSNRLTNVETGKLDKPKADGSWVVTKSGATITYTDASAFGQNIANTNLTWGADRTQNLNAKKLSFTGGRVSVPALELEITAANSVPNKIWTEGTYLWHANNLGISRKLIYSEAYPATTQFVATNTGVVNITLQRKTLHSIANGLNNTYNISLSTPVQNEVNEYILIIKNLGSTLGTAAVVNFPANVKWRGKSPALNQNTWSFVFEQVYIFDEWVIFGIAIENPI